MVKLFALGLLAALRALPRAVFEALLPPVALWLLLVGVGVKMQGVMLLFGVTPPGVVVFPHVAPLVMLPMGAVLTAGGIALAVYSASVYVNAFRCWTQKGV